MFDWLWKKAPPPEPPSVDRVWRDLAARDRAVTREAAAAELVIVAFFEATAAHVTALLAPVAVSTGRSCAVMLASELPRVVGPGAILVVERHPLPAANGELLRRLIELAPGRVPLFFSALDEPLMRALGGDRVTSLMDQLGLEADEAVEHPFVSKAMANAREKVAERLGSGPPSRARSMEEWLLVNGVGARR